MSPNTICKTVRQYSSKQIPEEDMRKLQEIAEDYRKVKNYVYERYGGIGSLSKLYPGYTVQNEMTDSGMRTEMGMPAVYFYLAVFEALGDIKSQWARTKKRILGLLAQNDNLSPEEKHYLRFLIKVNNAFEIVLNQKQMELPRELQQTYEELAAQVDVAKMNRYLCRQVRRYHVRLHTDLAEGFAVAERAYRYGDHGIYLSIKEKRKRVFVPLTDNKQYKCQIYVKLFPEENCVELNVPIRVRVKKHRDYRGQTGVAMGIYTMLTTDEGNRYGEELGKYQTEYADWMREQTGNYNRNRAANPGRKKYAAQKSRLEEGLHSYINQELNRFLRTEKPQIIYIAKLPKPQAGGFNKRINNSVAMWQRGYIRRRLAQKCKEQSIELVEVIGKNISSECSNCGAEGSKKDGLFSCPSCGYQAEEKINTARNVWNRGVKSRENGFL